MLKASQRPAVPHTGMCEPHTRKLQSAQRQQPVKASQPFYGTWEIVRRTLNTDNASLEYQILPTAGPYMIVYCSPTKAILGNNILSSRTMDPTRSPFTDVVSFLQHVCVCACMSTTASSITSKLVVVIGAIFTEIRPFFHLHITHFLASHFLAPHRSIDSTIFSLFQR